MAVRGFRQSGEFKESKGFGPAGAGLRDEKQKERGIQAGKELKEALERGRVSPEGTEYTGKLAETMMRQNLDQFNQRQLRRRAIEDAPQRPGIMQGLQNFGQGIMSNFSPGRMLASGIASALFGPIGGIIAGLLANKATTDAVKTDALDTVNFFRPNFNVNTPDADIVRAGDFNFLDRITDAIAAPNISTGVETLFAPRGTGLPEDFLDQSAVETQQLNPVATGMQYDDFINPDTGMFFNPELGSFDKMQ